MAADNDRREGRQFSDEELQDLVASADSGARNPKNRNVALLIAGLALAWSLFQLWIAQPMLWFGEWFSVMNSSQTRPLHLFFAIVLAFLAYPAFKSSPRDRIPVTDWILLAVGGFCAFYVFWFTDTLAMTARSGLPTQFQVIVGGRGHPRASGGQPPRAWSGVDHRGRALPALRLHGARLADPGPDRARGAELSRADQRAMAGYGRGLRHPSGRFDGLRLSLRAVRLAPGQGGGGQLLHQAGLRGVGPPARRTGEGGGRRLGHDRPDLGLLHRERRDDRPPSPSR